MNKLNFFKSNKIALAPMANVNGVTFRYFCKKYGCDIIYSPMLHVDNIIHNFSIVEQMCFNKKESPLAIQLVGNKKESFREAIKLIEPYCEIIDINFGCPDANIIKAKSGSYFLQHYADMSSLISSVTGYTNKPVTIKTRIGFNQKNIGKLVDVVNKNDIFALSLHGRTVKQHYSGFSDYDSIAKVKSLSNKPVIANGDICDENVLDVFNQTKCDAVMIGRRAMGNPFIFSAIKNKIDANYESKVIDRKKFLTEFYSKFLKLEKYQSIGLLKQHLSWICVDFEGSRQLRNSIMMSKSFEELEKILNLN